ncbi:MAG: CHASE2 domain-containing protein [Lyngbya sp. HA4199-MV5]|jgi:CHASE2 domain-containing sensor protein/two-component sensor histidine kinase|nr:CHASE2 domain-containing protein [Lyngbya sp. HA4199-MV5]
MLKKPTAQSSKGKKSGYRRYWKALQQESAVWRVGALPSVIVVGLVIAARLTGALQGLEWAVLDRMLRYRPAEPIDQRLVIVGINETDIRRIGTYPIPDRELAALLRKLQTYHPAVIGLDLFRDLPVQPGHSDLVQTLRELKNVIGVEKVLPDRSGLAVKPPPALPPEQVGFADALFDDDGALRRSLLGTSDEHDRYHFSLSIRLAERYLSAHGLSLGNGIRDPEAMRFGTSELTRFQPHTGGYVNADAGGNQMLLNVRTGRQPFRIVSLQDVQTGNVDPTWLQGKIALVGITAPSVKDTINSAAIASDNPALIYGVEMQAHAVSQIVSAVLDQRPLLQSWAEGWDYLWIVAWGLLGISLGRFIRSPAVSLLGLGLASAGLIGASYGALLWGWWLPVVPALLVLVLNGAGLTASLFYRYRQDWQARVSDRQLIIDHTFNAIHNGPLQTLAQLMRQVDEPSLARPQLQAKLNQLNQELRSIYDSVQRETLVQESSFVLSHDRELNLQAPLHEVLYELYSSVLERELTGFKTLTLKVINFAPLDEHHLSLEQKRGLCRFLEEALCNVGKHAIQATCLKVTCAQEQGLQVIRVTDNGKSLVATLPDTGVAIGLGTQQAQKLAKQLGGTFRRKPNTPKGMISELVWAVHRFWWWQFWLERQSHK